MSNRFHNKWHRHNHHTANGNEPDGGYDPIASHADPWKGDLVISPDGSTLSARDIRVTTISPFSGNWITLTDHVLITTLSALSATITQQNTLVNNLTGFVISGTDVTDTIHDIYQAGENSFVLRQIPISSTSWATFDKDLETKRNLIVGGEATVSTLTASGNIHANSIYLANSSIYFDSGIKIGCSNSTNDIYGLDVDMTNVLGGFPLLSPITMGAYTSGGLRAGTITIGNSAKGSGIYSVIIGSANNESSYNGLNNIVGYKNSIVGRETFLSSPQSVTNSILGYVNTVSGSNNTVLGSNSDIQDGNFNQSTGNYNTITKASYSSILGSYSTVTASSAIQLGRGTNSTPNSLQFQNVQIVSGGYICAESIGGTFSNLSAVNISVTDTIQASSYKSQDGTIGATGTITGPLSNVASITVKNGLITSWVYNM
jgi:hypothetical protein